MNLPTLCAPLDDLLGGGVEAGTITLTYGEAGTGKTNLALQLTRNAVLAGAGKAAYVDTEGVSLERLHQICGGDAPKVLRGTLFYAPHNLEEQLRMVRSLEKIKPPSLIVVDSLNMYYRLNLGENGGEKPSRALTQMLGALHHLARTREIPILVTGQVYTQDDQRRPFGGRIMEHIVKTMILLERTSPGQRRATLYKHRSRAEGAHCAFTIAQEGLAGPSGSPSAIPHK